MRIESVQTGEVLELNEDGANTLINAGIYTAADNKKPPKPQPKEPIKKPTPQKPTKVEPLTTDDMPSPPPRVA